MDRITPKTLVPISTILIVATTVGWFASGYSGIKHNEKEIINLKKEDKTIHNKLDDIIQRLSRIEGKIDN